jgi:hypothetical protein
MAGGGVVYWNSEQIQLKIFWSKHFLLNLFLTKCIRIMSCYRILSKKCCSGRFFNKKVRSSISLWWCSWCFCLFQPARGLQDSQETNRCCPGGEMVLTESLPCFLLVAGCHISYHYYILDHFVLYYGTTFEITYLVISFFNTGHTLSFCPLTLDNLRYYKLDHFIIL